MNKNVFTLGRSEIACIRDLQAHFRGIELSNDSLAESVFTHYRTTLINEQALTPLRTALTESLRLNKESRGYLLIDGIGDTLTGHEVNDLRLATAIASLVGRPFRAYKRWPLWKPLGVNSSVEPMRATGVGLNPFHIDLVNTENPPEYVTFFCIRADPAGGGDTMISNLHVAIDRLPPNAVEILKLPIYREGEFYDLSGVGSELNPFPVLGFTTEGFPRTRFSGKSVVCETPSADGAWALRLLGEALEIHRETFIVRRNQLLIINQLLVAHGRLPLGSQNCWHPDERRLVLQLFLRKECNAV